jgi:excisionase family DNA binding protein
MKQEISDPIDKREYEDYLMTDAEVAKLVKVSFNTVRYWRQTGILPFVRVGKHPRVWNSVLMGVFKKPGFKWAVGTDQRKK